MIQESGEFEEGVVAETEDSGKLLSGETVMAAKLFNVTGRGTSGNRRCVR